MVPLMPVKCLLSPEPCPPDRVRRQLKNKNKIESGMCLFASVVFNLCSLRAAISPALEGSQPPLLPGGHLPMGEVHP